MDRPFSDRPRFVSWRHTLVTFNGGLTATLPTARCAARGASGGEAGGHSTCRPKTSAHEAHPQRLDSPPGSSQHNLSRSARCAERTHRSNEHPFRPCGRRLDSYQLHPASQLPSPDAGLPNLLSSREEMGSHVKLDSCVVALHCTRPQAQPIRSQFLIPCSSRQMSVFHPLPLFHWMREIGASRSGHICTPSHLPDSDNLSTGFSIGAAFPTPTCRLRPKRTTAFCPLAWQSGWGTWVRSSSISFSSWYSARHTITALYRRLLRTSVPHFSPDTRQAKGYILLTLR